MALGQIVALVVVNKCMKFHYDISNSKEVMTNVKVLRRQTRTDRQTDNAGATTIARCFQQTS